jgi:hypothetical protein
MQVRGLLATLLALAVVAAVSPVFVMPGCTMSGAPFDFSCEHGIISEHITESSTGLAGPIVAAVVVAALFMAPLRRLLPSTTYVETTQDVFADPLGERTRL